jgi:amidohydrolase family protein
MEDAVARYPISPRNAFDPTRATHGVDALIKSLRDNGIAANSNVYAELDSTWRFVLRDPTMAAHLFGKLLVHVGQDNVLWGTDLIWYGSPQDQIQAFRSFEIAPKLLDTYRYPELTPRLKAKIFGLNGARVYGVDIPAERKKTEADPIGVRKQAYRKRAAPVFEPSGPRPTASSRRSWPSTKACQPSTCSFPSTFQIYLVVAKQRLMRSRPEPVARPQRPSVKGRRSNC